MIERYKVGGTPNVFDFVIFFSFEISRNNIIV
jgi:hypothetical protein